MCSPTRRPPIPSVKSTLMNKMMEYPDGSRDTAYCIELGVEVNYPEDYENVEDLIPDPQHLRLVGDALTFWIQG